MFHILLPTLGDEDMSGFEQALVALTSCDSQLKDEVFRNTIGSISDCDSVSLESISSRPEQIMIDRVESDSIEMRKLFGNVRAGIFPMSDRYRVQKYCKEKGIVTSVEYIRARMTDPSVQLPEQPFSLSSTTTWFDFLHPTREVRMSPVDFVKTIVDPNNLRTGEQYDKWLQSQTPEVSSDLPSVQNITDGFFGKEETNFNTLREKYGKRIIGRAGRFSRGSGF
jgi:hypothetical protein